MYPYATKSYKVYEPEALLASISFLRQKMRIAPKDVKSSGFKSLDKMARHFHSTDLIEAGCGGPALGSAVNLHDCSFRCTQSVLTLVCRYRHHCKSGLRLRFSDPTSVPGFTDLNMSRSMFGTLSIDCQSCRGKLLLPRFAEMDNPV